MASVSSIKRAVKTAFNAAGDIVRNATFTKNVVSSFNFSTSEAAEAAAETTVVRCIPQSKVKTSSKDGISVITSSISVPSEDLGDISIYSTVTIDGVIWRVGSVTEDNGFLKTINISRSTR